MFSASVNGKSVSSGMLSLPEAAALCKILPATFLRLVRAKFFPPAEPGTIVWKREGIEQALERLYRQGFLTKCPVRKSERVPLPYTLSKWRDLKVGYPRLHTWWRHGAEKEKINLPYGIAAFTAKWLKLERDYASRHPAAVVQTKRDTKHKPTVQHTPAASREKSIEPPLALSPPVAPIANFRPDPDKNQAGLANSSRHQPLRSEGVTKSAQLRTSDIAARFGFTRRYWIKLASVGKIPGARQPSGPGGGWLFDRELFESWWSKLPRRENETWRGYIDGERPIGAFSNVTAADTGAASRRQIEQLLNAVLGNGSSSSKASHSVKRHHAPSLNARNYSSKNTS